ncbi:MAG: hypothetical protein WC941_11250 [Candidatus Bathyarchaeia archaeon]
MVSASLVLMLVLPSIAIASINDSDGDQIDDSLELRMERKMFLETEAYKVKVHSEFRNATRQNEWEFQLSTDEGVKLELGFSTRISALKREIESELELYRLFEFADADGDGMLTAGEELQTIDLRSVSFSMPSVTNITSQDGENGYRLSAQLLNQVYALKVFADFFPKHALIDGAAVTPTEAKVTFTMSGFQYTRPNSQLALRLKMSSESEMGESQDPVGGESEVHIRSANATGFFSWSTDAKIDSVPKPVKSSVTTTLKGRFITLSYPRGTEIIHDPKIGVSVAATTVPGGTTQPTDPLDAIRSDISNLGSSIDDKTTSMSGEIDSLSKGVTSVSDDVTQMRQTVDGLSTIAYASTGMAIIAILAAAYLFFKK